MKIDSNTQTTPEEHQRKYIAEMAMKGATIKPLGKMCGSCAFKLDSDANLEPHNVDAAFQTVAFEQNVFNCHEEIGVDKGCLCVGFLHAKQYSEARFKNKHIPIISTHFEI